MEEEPQTPGASEPPPEPARVPTLEEMAALLPQYEFHARIGLGGMGAVFLARQPALDRMVAIKVTPPLYEDQADEAARFITEARAMAKLVHPHIVAVFDFGQTGEGHLFIVMEHIEGTDLQNLIRARQVDHNAAINIIHQLCDALQFAHEHRVVHRDIKPSNILITAGPSVKVADFGLAKDLTDPAAADDGYGTPDYAAPERFIAGAPIDPRTDIFSLGVLMHEMLTGLTPRQAAERGGAHLPPLFSAVIGRCMLAEPARRFQTARDVKAALSATAHPAHPHPAAHHPPHPRPLPRPAHHHAPPPAPAVPGSVWALGSLAIVAALGWFVFSGRQKAPEPAAPPSRTTVVSPAPSAPSSTAPASGSLPSASTLPQSQVTMAPAALLTQSLPAYAIPDGEPGEVKLLMGHREPVLSVAILPDQRRIVSAGADDTLRIWDAQEGKELGQLSDARTPVFRAMLSQDGKKLLAVCRPTVLVLWDLATGAVQTMKTLPPGADGVYRIPTALGISPDGKSVIFSLSGMASKMWKWMPDESDTPVPLPDMPFLPRRGLPLPDGTLLVNAADFSSGKMVGAEVQALSWATGQATRTFSSIKDSFSSFALSPDGGTLAAGTSIMYLCDWKNDRVLSTIRGHNGSVMSCFFLDGGRLMLTGSLDKSMRIWETATGKELVRFDSPIYAFSHVSVSKDERWAVSGGTHINPRDNKDPAGFALRIWRLPRLGTLGDPAGMEKSAEAQLASLATVDPELAALKAETDAATKAPTLDELARQIGDLNSKYLAALRREAPRASPADSKAMLEEAERIAAGEFIDPDASDSTLAPGMRRMRGIYRDQLVKLEADHNSAAKAAAENLNTKAQALAEKRRSASDAMGEARIRALISTTGRQIKLSKEFGVFGSRVTPLPQP